ncbi:hypothetical protein ACRASX_14895 [Flavobacterium sp. TMP13]|uniref:hypothetical protein n=1 Tax=Flavobacterium sp. TMP13 TaxID=3425950 RepID=UPI003D776957
MKNFLLCTAILFLLFSCTTDADSNLEVKDTNLSDHKIVEVSFPLNPANPYDFKGKSYYDAVQVYLQNNKSPQNIEEINSQIYFISEFYKSSKTGKKTNLGFTPEEILSILNNPTSKLFEIVANSSLSTVSKLQLSDFIQDLIDNQNDQYIVMRDQIILFDAEVLANDTLNNTEKEIILTFSTVSSYALYAEAERKDRDWETSVGHKKVNTSSDQNLVPFFSMIALLNAIL